MDKCWKNAEKSELSYIAGGNIKGAAALKAAWQFFKKLNLQLIYDPEISLQENRKQMSKQKLVLEHL